MPPSEAGVAPAAAVSPAAWRNIPGVHVIVHDSITVRAVGSFSTDSDMLDLFVARFRSIVLKQMCRCPELFASVCIQSLQEADGCNADVGKE